jgi:hypothetical protein
MPHSGESRLRAMRHSAESIFVVEFNRISPLIRIYMQKCFSPWIRGPRGIVYWRNRKSRETVPFKVQCHEFFDPRLFSLKHPSWAPDWGAKAFLNTNLNSRSYSKFSICMRCQSHPAHDACIARFVRLKIEHISANSKQNSKRPVNQGHGGHWLMTKIVGIGRKYRDTVPLKEPILKWKQ